MNLFIYKFIYLFNDTLSTFLLTVISVSDTWSQGNAPIIIIIIIIKKKLKKKNNNNNKL